MLDETFLFSASVRDNIAYGRPDADITDVERVARLAGAHGFITELPGGYDTVIGERGYTLSGGQRQRLAIARVLLANPPVLVLDDATSAVDVQVEREIHAGLRTLPAGRTTLVIAHRVSTISLAGQVALLAIGAGLVRDRQLTIGELVAFLLSLGAFFQPIQQLVQQYNTYQQGQSSIVKLRQLLGTRPEVEQAPGAVDLPEVQGAVVFEDVAFGYLPDRPVISDVSLAVRAGETVALVGPTGAGKSTLAKLVTRFYDPTQGRVLIDGHDLRDVRLDSLRRQLVALARAFLARPRLSTAMKADRIVVIDGGRIVEAGPHEQLVAAGGRYARMYATWTSQAAAVR
nr:ATP-binding cassette domain-containing protein [Catenulispora pinistramenti]